MTTPSQFEGVLDLAFLESDRWTVIDFKTDRELETALEHYRKQVALYTGTVTRATQLDAVPILLCEFETVRPRKHS